MNKTKQDYFRAMNRNSPKPKEPKTDIRIPGNLITLHFNTDTVELGCVLNHISKKELKSYVEENNIDYDKDSEVWECNYSVVGFYPREELTDIVMNKKFDDKPTLNILIVKVLSKTTYNIVIGTDNEFKLMYNTIKKMTQSKSKVNEYLDKLLNASALTILNQTVVKNQKEASKSNSTANKARISLKEE